MFQAFVVTFCDNETETQVKQIVRRENGYIATPPDGQEWYKDIALTYKYDFNERVTENLKLYSSVPIFDDETIGFFGDWLTVKAENNSVPYKVKLRLNETFINARNNDVYTVLTSNINKYVNLDFSGSTFTKINNNNTFSGCTNITSVTLGSMVNYIDSSTFTGCSNLTEINVVPSNEDYFSNSGILYLKSANGNVLAKYPVKKQGPSFDVPNSIKSIGNRAFEGCTNLTSVNIPDSVIDILTNAFNSCNNLNKVTIGNEVLSIGNSAFMSCSKLKYVDIGNSVSEILSNAFQDCTSLESITIPASVQNIYDYAFTGCTALTTVIFETGSNIQDANFGNNAFPDIGNIVNGLKNAYKTGKAGTYKLTLSGSWQKQ